MTILDIDLVKATQFLHSLSISPISTCSLPSKEDLKDDERDNNDLYHHLPSHSLPLSSLELATDPSYSSLSCQNHLSSLQLREGTFDETQLFNFMTIYFKYPHLLHSQKDLENRIDKIILNPYYLLAKKVIDSPLCLPYVEDEDANHSSFNLKDALELLEEVASKSGKDMLSNQLDLYHLSIQNISDSIYDKEKEIEGLNSERESLLSTMESDSTLISEEEELDKLEIHVDKLRDSILNLKKKNSPVETEETMANSQQTLSTKESDYDNGARIRNLEERVKKVKNDLLKQNTEFHSL